MQNETSRFYLIEGQFAWMYVDGHACLKAMCFYLFTALRDWFAGLECMMILGILIGLHFF